jgi:hypothetical protein
LGIDSGYVGFCFSSLEMFQCMGMDGVRIFNAPRNLLDVRYWNQLGFVSLYVPLIAKHLGTHVYPVSREINLLANQSVEVRSVGDKGA